MTDYPRAQWTQAELAEHCNRQRAVARFEIGPKIVLPLAELLGLAEGHAPEPTDPETLTVTAVDTATGTITLSGERR